MKKTILPFIDIKSCINNNLQNNSFVYLILDAAQVSKQALKFINNSRANSNIEIYSLFSGTTEGNAPFEVSPLIIILKDNNVLNSEFLNEMWKKEQVLSIVFSKLELMHFSKMMKQYLTVILPDGSSKLFRWFDPRVLKKIDKILTNDQQEVFFKEIENWVLAIRNYHDVELNQIMVWGEA